MIGYDAPPSKSWVRRFALAVPPDLAEYERVLPMRRVDFSEELRTYPWGTPPPRPGDPLPVVQGDVDPGLPQIITREGTNEERARGDVAARFGRVDPYGRRESGHASEAREAPP